jgi:hypothetical protein
MRPPALHVSWLQLARAQGSQARCRPRQLQLPRLRPIRCRQVRLQLEDPPAVERPACAARQSTWVALLQAPELWLGP